MRILSDSLRENELDQVHDLALRQIGCASVFIVAIERCHNVSGCRRAPVVKVRCRSPDLDKTGRIELPAHIQAFARPDVVFLKIR